MKGILNVKDTDKPVVIHGVQHVFHPPATLDAWPEGDDRKSRVVLHHPRHRREHHPQGLRLVLRSREEGLGARDQEHSSVRRGRANQSAVFADRKMSSHHGVARQRPRCGFTFAGLRCSRRKR
jgi:hypothetical protein